MHVQVMSSLNVLLVLYAAIQHLPYQTLVLLAYMYPQVFIPWEVLESVITWNPAVMAVYTSHQHLLNQATMFFKIQFNLVYTHYHLISCYQLHLVAAKTATGTNSPLQMLMPKDTTLEQSVSVTNYLHQQWMLLQVGSSSSHQGNASTTKPKKSLSYSSLLHQHISVYTPIFWHIYWVFVCDRHPEFLLHRLIGRRLPNS